MTSPTPQQISNYLHSLSNAEIAEHSQKFFKSGEGEYGHGDKFLGIRVPVIRQAVKQNKTASMDVAEELLQSEYHEIRLFALILLVQQFSRADSEQQEKIFRLYLHNTQKINNWDLVDTSAPPIVGGWLSDKNRSLLYELAQSDSLWERRIAVMATFHFIRNNDFEDALTIVEMLLNDREDLIHKAAGWMLREIGKRQPDLETAFLDQHSKQMPRTMLRYAIEKFDKKDRQRYLNL